MRIKRLLPYLKATECVLLTDELDPRLEPLCTPFARIMRAPLDKLPDIAATAGINAFLCDHYALDARLERKFKAQGPVAVIDDLANRPHDCNLLIDQGIERQPEHYQPLVNSDCAIFTGPDYALLNPDFAALPAKDLVRLQHPDQKPRVLVCFGGSDPVHGCLHTLRAIAGGKLWQDYSFELIAGAGSTDFAALCSQCAACQEKSGCPPEGICVLRHEPDMAAAYKRNDLAIGAYGVMFAERLCAGIPAICVEIADNQQGAGKVLKRHKLGVDLSLSRLADPHSLRSALHSLCSEAAQVAANGRKLYDGLGLKRSAALINARLS